LLAKKWGICPKKIYLKKLKRSSDKQTAFTLIELLITISLVIIIITFTVPNQFYLTNTILQNEIETLYTTITYLQQKAIASNTKQKLVFCVATNSYRYKQRQKTVTHTLHQKIAFGYLAHTKGPPSSPIHAITQPITFHDHQILLLPNGKITPGTVYFVDQEKKYMGALTTSIAQVSFIRNYTYTNKKWVYTCPRGM